MTSQLCPVADRAMTMDFLIGKSETFHVFWLIVQHRLLMVSRPAMCSLVLNQRLTEQVEVHVFLFFFLLHNLLLLLLLLLCGATTATAAAATTRVSSRICCRVGEELLGFLNLLELDVDISTEGCNILHCVGEHVWNTCFSWNSNLATKCSHMRAPVDELGNDDILAHVEHCCGEDSSILNDNFDGHVQCLEQCGLGRIHSGGPCRDDNITWGYSSHLGSLENSVLLQDLTDGIKRTACSEDETNVPIHSRKDRVKSKVRVFTMLLADSCADHCVLATKNHCLSTEIKTDL